VHPDRQRLLGTSGGASVNRAPPAQDIGGGPSGQSDGGWGGRGPAGSGAPASGKRFGDRPPPAQPRQGWDARKEVSYEY
jgi:hypothetical protein